MGLVLVLVPLTAQTQAQAPAQEPEAQAVRPELADQVTLARLGVQEVWVLSSQASAGHPQEMVLLPLVVVLFGHI